MGIVAGADIGGTTIKLGIFKTPDMELLEKWAILTDLTDKGSRIIPSVAEEIRKYLKKEGWKEEDLEGIGMGIPGPVGPDGHVTTCVNLFWEDFNPVTEMKKEFPQVAKIAAGNDANVAALGEYVKGAGGSKGNMMFVTLGTGVGGGIILDGKILLGTHGIGGEIGHVAVGPTDSGNCNCGNCGCVDQFASATGIVRRMKRILSEKDTPSPLRELEEITAKDVCDYAREGDELAQECLDLYLGVLGRALAIYAHAFDPDVFVIGGGVSHGGQVVLDAIEKTYAPLFHLIPHGGELRLARLGGDAGMIGAAALARTE